MLPSFQTVPNSLISIVTILLVGLNTQKIKSSKYQNIAKSVEDILEIIAGALGKGPEEK